MDDKNSKQETVEVEDKVKLETSEIKRSIEKKIESSSENILEDGLILNDSPENNNRQIMNLIVKKDDVTWKTIILELVNSNRMDPWNIDIKMLTKGYVKTIKELKGHDFRVSGNMIVAAALLLKIKSSRLLVGDLNALDQLLASTQELEDVEGSDDIGMVDEVVSDEILALRGHELIPRTPQPRKRKVSIYDLVDALEKALEVKERRIMKKIPELQVEMPTKKLPDVSILMGHLYEKIEHMFAQKGNDVFFNDLAPSRDWNDRVITFIPLLHLDNMSKISLTQSDHFGSIHVAPYTNVEMDVVNELVTKINE